MEFKRSDSRGRLLQQIVDSGRRMAGQCREIISGSDSSVRVRILWAACESDFDSLFRLWQWTMAVADLGISDRGTSLIFYIGWVKMCFRVKIKNLILVFYRGAANPSIPP